MTTWQGSFLVAQWGQKPDREDLVGSEKANTAHMGNFEKLHYNIMKLHFLYSITIFKQNVTSFQMDILLSVNGFQRIVWK